MPITRKYILVITWLLIAFSTTLYSQIDRVTGKAQVRVERNMTYNETKELAKQLAIINAIENAFGTYAEQQTDMTIKDGMTSYNIIGTTKVKGEWIETLDLNFNEDFKREKTDDGVVSTKYITCFIKGKARKRIPKATLDYEILNHPNIHARTSNFYHEEQLYVFFKSPVFGYVSIFLEDDNAVYRLLPYINMRDEYQSGVPVKGDTDYLFFSPNDNSYPGNSVDEQLILSLKEYTEYNFVYIVFSEDQYVKPMLDESRKVENRIIPKQLTTYKFQKWLVKNRASSEKFQDIRVKISIDQK